MKPQYNLGDFIFCEVDEERLIGRIQRITYDEKSVEYLLAFAPKIHSLPLFRVFEEAIIKKVEI